jgi:hypothetical protein
MIGQPELVIDPARPKEQSDVPEVWIEVHMNILPSMIEGVKPAG